MLAIKNNLMAQNAARNLNTSYNQLSTSVQRLSSGLRINSAKDDAAGLAVRELIRADVAALEQGARNAQDGVSLLQTAEGALGEIDAILVRMRELAEQAATDTYSSTQKSIMQSEFDELAAEITRIADTTDFNDINLLETGASGSVKIGLGQGVSDTDLTINVDKQDMTAENLGLLGKKETAVFGGTDAPTITDTSSDVFMNNNGTEAGTVTVSFAGQNVDITIASGASVTMDSLKSTLESGFGTNASVSITGDASSGYSLKVTAATTGDATDISFASNSGGDIEFGTAGGTDVATGSGQFTITAGSDGLDLTDGLDTAIDAVNDAIETKDTYRASLGYWMNRMEFAASVLDVQAENLRASESRISDVDVATEMSSMTRNQVLAQAGISMLAQANSMPQMALQLLG